ncbi:hypothetical protein AKJ09_02804 [Labilithrix luteola]|uniref:Galactose oxidase n=1 Tax=Labilithrix luteola TaxID=1391654 RepID=A0A0K1PRG8_9BACT|nr:hypothetical protein [Labilithrix luteola]AKU96140.1 hypothetical protein AKJ09_02804 [Labilithrix luteola]
MGTLNGKVVLVGGYDGTDDVSNACAWDGATWTQSNVQGPSARGAHAMSAL